MNPLEGIIPVDKPQTFTSFDVVAKLRGITKTKTIGHSGTLDPMATGVLPVFFGRATKAIDLLPDHDKTYQVEFQLGTTTDTQDITGKVLGTRPFDHVTANDVAKTLAMFLGEQTQLPPMYSAVKVDGRKLVDLARRGVEIDRKVRSFTVYNLEIIADSGAEKSNSGVFKATISCSRGTYIRTICHDLGQKLGCGAVMTALTRTKACGFSLSECYTLPDIERLRDLGELESRLLPIDSAFKALTKFYLNGKQAEYFCSGLHLGLYQFESVPIGATLAVYRDDGRFLGLAEAKPDSDKLSIIKQFALRENI